MRKRVSSEVDPMDDGRVRCFSIDTVCVAQKEPFYTVHRQLVEYPHRTQRWGTTRHVVQRPGLGLRTTNEPCTATARHPSPSGSILLKSHDSHPT